MAEIKTRNEALALGLKKFSPGTICKRGHISERWTSTGGCIECVAAYAKEKAEAARAARQERSALGHQEDQPNRQGGSEMVWDSVERGRFATSYKGHSLQVARNPDAEDPRRYISIVDRVPLEQASWNIGEAKTKAIKYVDRPTKARPSGPSVDDLLKEGMREVGSREAERPSSDPTPARTTDAYPDPGMYDFDLPSLHEEGDLATLTRPTTEAVAEVAEAPPAPEPSAAEPAPDMAKPPAVPQRGQPDDAVVAHITVRMSGQTIPAALAALEAAVQMLREIGEVEARAHLPSRIQL